MYESVELDIAFFNRNSNGASEDKKRPFDSPIHLEADPTSPARYFCSHAGGVHAVGLPMVTKLAEMAAGGEAADATLSCLQGQESSLVEHLICTQLSATSRPSPVLGLALHYPPAQLICLLSDYSIQTVALSPPYFASPPPLASSTSPLGNKGRTNQESSECSFEEVIRRTLLKKSSTHPMMRAAPAVGKADVEKEEMLDIVTKSAQVCILFSSYCTAAFLWELADFVVLFNCFQLQTLREEYLTRLEKARSDIERRVAHLRSQKQSQAASLDKLNSEKTNLRDRAAVLSERYEDLQDNGQRLRTRIEIVLQKLQRQVPIGSDAELRMQRQLQDLERKTREMRSSMERIAAKERYQMRQIDEENQRRRSAAADKSSKWR